jgi:hypothetical protein
MTDILITHEQAETMLKIIEHEIDLDGFDAGEFRDVEQVTHYFRRAVLRERLINAIKNVKGK